jgi:hypothetical protein
VKKHSPKRRAKNLTKAEVDAIVGLIDGWTGKLTWDLLREAIASRTSQIYERQALASHEAIQRAFTSRKSTPTAAKKAFLSPELEVAEQAIDRLEATVKRLTHENNTLIEQFVRWAHNASLRGLDEDFLNQPLLPVNREKTKEDGRRLGKMRPPRKGAS